MIVAVDTNVIVAALAPWHGQHEPARRALDEFRAQHSLILPRHALMEAYSVLTRVPAAIRLAPLDALRLLKESFGDLPLPMFAVSDLWRWIEELAHRGISGGRIYDAAIAHTAREAGAEAILTFNTRHFWDEGLKVLSP